MSSTHDQREDLHAERQFPLPNTNGNDWEQAWAAIARAGMWLQPCWVCGQPIVTNQRIACCKACWEQLPARYPG